MPGPVAEPDVEEGREKEVEERRSLDGLRDVEGLRFRDFGFRLG